MNPILLVALIIPVGFVAALVFRGIVGWMVHISQTKCFSERYGWGDYDKFKQHFELCDWKCVGCEGNYLIADNFDSEYGASIIKFNGIGMLMRTPIDWFLANLYVEEYREGAFGKVEKGNYKW